MKIYWLVMSLQSWGHLTRELFPYPVRMPPGVPDYYMAVFEDQVAAIDFANGADVIAVQMKGGGDEIEAADTV